MYHILVNIILTPENEIHMPDIPQEFQHEGGILAPKGYGSISLPENAGSVITPKGIIGEQTVTVPETGDLLKYGGIQESSSERKSMSSSEIARAFGNFNIYFAGKVREYFPSHGNLPRKPVKEAYGRVYEEKTYFDRYSGKREAMRASKPGPVEEECLVAIRIASEPSFVGTVVASKAISKANALLYSGRTKTGEAYQQQLPEMPTLLAEVENYLGRLHTQRGMRYEAYDLLNQTQIPASEISELALFMQKSGDLKHPLAYRLLAESVADSEFYREQLERREKILSLLSGDAEKMTEMYPYLKDLARGLVCSVDLKNPPSGRVGVEIEFGLGRTAALGSPSGFRTYRDVGNWEISRNLGNTKLDETYLRDLGILAMYLRDGATHISSLHLHLDRDQHPHEPNMGFLLGNVMSSTVRKSHDKNTWEVRGLLPPAQGNELDPACIADIIQLYINASAESLDPKGTIRLPEGMDPALEQIIFAHICRFVSTPEGRLAALKVLEHPLVLRGVDPKVLMEDFVEEDQKKVYQALKSGLVGKYAKRSLKLISRRYGFEGVTKYERLTEQEITAQYEDMIGVFTRTEILQRLETGEMGIIGIDGKEYPIPTIEDVLAQMREKAEVLGPKMEQGFRKLLVVPFGMKVEDLAYKYGQTLLEHHKNGGLLATKDEKDERDIRLKLNTVKPVEIPGNADMLGELVYYPEEFSIFPNGKKKEELLDIRAVGWKILLVEDLPNLPAQGFGVQIGGRLQLEANMSPRTYLELLKSDSMYTNEIGMTPEDWLTYALLHLEETDQVIDDWEGNGKCANLPGAYFADVHNVPYFYWNRFYGGALLSYIYPEYENDQQGVRTAVSVN